jgi:hypothetical protein
MAPSSLGIVPWKRFSIKETSINERHRPISVGIVPEMPDMWIWSDVRAVNSPMLAGSVPVKERPSNARCSGKQTTKRIE